MTTHEKNIIKDIYNIVKKEYISATDEHERDERRAQCFIIMHIMQTFGFWNEYKNENDTTTEKEWFN